MKARDAHKKNENKTSNKNEEEEKLELPKVLRAKKKELSEWYHQILFLADIVDIRYNLKGMNVWKNYGYETMLNLKRYWDYVFKKNGLKELYFPQIVPIEYCEQNPEWWNGFKEQGFKVIAGEKDEIQGALRPTGEAAMYPMYAIWIKTFRDLPLRAYETVSSFRYETRHTRPLIRDREITLWHEIHTVHATKEDCLKEAQNHIAYYKQLWTFVAVHPLIVDKPKWELFPGAIGGIEFYNITPDGKVMENGSVNNLGQAYAKKFNIKFKDSDNTEKIAWQVCTGNGARLLAAALIQHGDDKGLVLPPNIAPYQVVIVPILFEKEKEIIMKNAETLKEMIENAGIRVLLDDREETPGRKFYDWEIKGVPLRAEIGPEDIKKNQVVLVKRNDGKKIAIKREILVSEVNSLLKTIQEELLKKSQKETVEGIDYADSLKNMEKLLEKGKCTKIHWCRKSECYDRVKAVKEGAEIFGSDYYEKKKGRCIACSEETDNLAYVAKTY